MSQQQLIQEGKDLIGKLRFSEAEQVFQKAHQQDSKSLEALYWLSVISFMGLQNDQGLEYLKQALDIDSEDARTLALNGAYLLTKGENQKVIDQLKKAQQKDPNISMIHSNLANAYYNSGKLDQAEKAARHAIRLNPKDFLSRYRLSSILARTNRLKEGIQELLECIRINPVYIQPYLILAELYIRGGKEQTAVSLLHYGLKQNPKAFPLRERLCDFYTSKSRYDLAYRESVELVTRRKFYGDFLRIGTYAVAIGSLDKAQKAFTSLRAFEESWGLTLDQLCEKTKMPKPPDPILGQVEKQLKEATPTWSRPIRE